MNTADKYRAGNRLTWAQSASSTLWPGRQARPGTRWSTTVVTHWHTLRTRALSLDRAGCTGTWLPWSSRSCKSWPPRVRCPSSGRLLSSHTRPPPQGASRPACWPRSNSTAVSEQCPLPGTCTLGPCSD